MHGMIKLWVVLCVVYQPGVMACGLATSGSLAWELQVIVCCKQSDIQRFQDEGVSWSWMLVVQCDISPVVGLYV